jgi:ABC-type phosphate/phosphonate transport system permease subunit
MAAVGPFVGVLGVALHTAGSLAELWAEAIEATEPGPVESARMSGAGGLRVFLHAQLPDALPQLSSIQLYLWEFNVRASTVLGVVGAGGLPSPIPARCKSMGVRFKPWDLLSWDLRAATSVSCSSSSTSSAAGLPSRM